uniref:Uncharacterized protein n=1 Tax=Tetradesmus obliquus TaxID=3088 RepID=A0A383WEQ8_TETOB|eukprot:jgi/Sobl393_1/5929/SZX75494.1
MAELDAPDLDKDQMYELLEATFAAGAWSLLDVCCMCASSKLLRSAWLQLLRQQPKPAWLLAAVADAAHAKTLPLRVKANAVMHWLLNSLPEARLAEHPSIPAGLLAIPRMPENVAKEMYKLGIRVPYKNIVAAARLGVEGVETWIIVKSFLGLADDIPHLIKNLYNGSAGNTATWDDIGQIDDASLCDVLYLSINGNNRSTPRAVNRLACTSRSTAQLSTSEVLDLLRTAVERGHTYALSSILLRLGILSCVAELTPEQLLPVMKRAIVLDASTSCRTFDDSSPGYTDVPCYHLFGVLPLPAVQQLPADAVAALMSMALEVAACGNLKALCKLPAAKHIGPAQLSSIVVAAAAKEDDDSLKLLAEAAAFQQLQPAAAAAALQAAVRAGSTDLLTLLLNSTAVAAADDVLVPALVLAMTVHQYKLSAQQVLSALLDKAGVSMTLAPVAVEAAPFSADGCCQVLAAALEGGNIKAFQRPWKLPAADTMQGKQLEHLLRCAAAAALPPCGGPCIKDLHGLWTAT